MRVWLWSYSHIGLSAIRNMPFWIEGIFDKHYCSYCSYSCGSLVGWFFCFARRWVIDTYTASASCNLDSSLAVDWQKALEITSFLFF